MPSPSFSSHTGSLGVAVCLRPANDRRRAWCTAVAMIAGSPFLRYGTRMCIADAKTKGASALGDANVQR